MMLGRQPNINELTAQVAVFLCLAFGLTSAKEQNNLL
jgi:hypothetical protein